MFTEKNSLSVLEAFFNATSISANQIDSFNDFINFGVQSIVDQEPVISNGNYTVKFGRVYISPPQIIDENRNLVPIYPASARIGDLTYDSAIMCDITEKWADNGEIKVHPKQIIGRMPIMLYSKYCNLTSLSPEEKIKKGECPKDPGGYFIVKGNERVLVGQMRANYNQIFVIKQKPESKFKYVADIRSMSEETGHSVLVQAMFGNDDRSIKFSLPYIKERIPVGVVFKAFGFEEEDFESLIGLHCKKFQKYLKFIIRDSAFCKTKKDCLDYIGKYAMHIINDDKKEAYAWQVIESELYPHLGISGTIKEQALLLGDLVRKLLMTELGFRKEDDRDNLANKRIDLVGPLMYDIFRNLYKKYLNAIRGVLEKRKQIPDILSIISRIKGITKGLNQCLATGNWSVQKNATYMKTGVSQVLDRMTYYSMLSHLRRILIPGGKEGKNTAICQIHQSSIGFIDPCETPEGQKVGKVLNFCITARATKRLSSIDIKRVVEDCKTIVFTSDLKIQDIKNKTRVYLNGAILGITEDPEKTIDELKMMRGRNILDKDVSITFDIIDGEIKIFSDEGRFSRPVLTLKDNKLLIPPQTSYDWNTLIKKGYIQYLDASEIESSVLAMTLDKLKIQNNDFCEIHPTVILGIISGKIPFPDHSQSPRNCYSSSMQKQALGIPMLSYNTRTDTILHVLDYPQKPILSTHIAKLSGVNDMPSGINAIVAIASWATNQEDSVCLNLSAIQRGMFCLTSYRSYDCFEKKKDTYSYEKICVPPENSEKTDPNSKGYFIRKKGNYSLLDKNGIIRTRSETGSSIYVKKGDVLVGKILISGNKNGEEIQKDASVIVQPGEEGFIDKVFVTTNPSGFKLVKVIIRVHRAPTLGDKIASQTGQKGTIGMVYRQEDLPFTHSGIVPDIIINSCCMPSRMTINQLIECALGKEAVIMGKYMDTSPFTEDSVNVADKMVKRISENITAYGLSPQGSETMYSGTTGEMIKAKIFIGPTYYQRLKHMVDDKMHARAKGSVTMLTRQPLEGRSRDGGLRFGEMERDCMIAHGASRFLKERLFNVSDPFKVVICDKCHNMTTSSKNCNFCNKDEVSNVNIPYASKLLVTELMGMGIKVGMNSNKK